MSVAICMNESQLLLTSSHLDDIIQRYVFPAQFILGVTGNCINLIVLLSKGMRSETNSLLSAMAFADLSLLLCMLPHSIASFGFAYRSYFFRYFYYITKRQLNAMANLFSAAATWLVLAVSIERFIGIRSPMHARLQWKDGRVMPLIVVIFLGAFFVTFYHHVAYKCNVYVVCNGSQLRGSVMPVEYNWTGNELYGTFVAKYVHYGKYVQLITVVLMPIIAVAFLNVSLICIMRNRDVVERNCKSSAKLDDKLNRSNSETLTLRNHGDASVLQRQERKVTATVLAIVTCFTVTHAPSLIPFVWETLGISTYNPRPFLATVSIVNSLVITGKVLNFVLFCSSSVHFRKRLIAMLLSQVVSCIVMYLSFWKKMTPFNTHSLLP
uniref:G-protein coupled receptors family 1 profile domain-containing protein n=1 Tax=Parascaris univalens TaxID=6257 RepID=A0A915AVS7_PARUN